MRRPVRMSSFARYFPTARVRRCVPPAPGMIPRLISGWPNCAVSEATMMSQIIASSQPPPRAYPETAAMIGVLILRIASHRVVRSCLSIEIGVAMTKFSLMSAPAANARSLPVSTPLVLPAAAGARPTEGHAVRAHTDERDDLRPVPPDLCLDPARTVAVVVDPELVGAGRRAIHEVRHADPAPEELDSFVRREETIREPGLVQGTPEPISRSREVQADRARPEARIDADE